MKYFTNGFIALAPKIKSLSIQDLTFLDAKEHNYRLNSGEKLLSIQPNVKLKDMVRTGNYSHKSNTWTFERSRNLNSNLKSIRSIDDTSGNFQWEEVEATIANGRLVLTSSALYFEGDTQSFTVHLISIGNIDLAYNTLVLRPKNGSPIKFEIPDFDPYFAVVLIKILE